MQNLIGIIIVVVVIGGGYYFFTQSNSEPKGDEAMMEESHDGEMMDDDSMKDDGAMMDDNNEAMDDGAMMDEGSIVEFTVEGQNFSLSPNVINVKKGDTVRVTFKNVGGFHDFVIDEFSVATKQINTDQEEVVEFVADQAGSFEFYCSVGNHRAQGMFGSLVVSE